MKYKKALFINPYPGNSVTAAMMAFPPTGLEYVAQSAREVADKVTLLDLRYEKELAVPAQLNKFIKQEADIIGVGIGWDRQIKEIMALLNSFPVGMPLVVGGYTATEKVEEFFKDCPRIDVIVRGEGEQTIKDILNGVAWESIPGMSFRRDKKITHNPNRPLVDVDNIPWPNRTLRRGEYSLVMNGFRVPGLSFDTVLTARGCPYNCKFCTFTMNPLGQKREYSARGVKSVLDEIESLKAKIILFSDENFSLEPARAEAICDGLIERKIKKRYVVQTRVEIARYPRLLEKMVRAGFKLLLVGVESPHDRILLQLNKGFDSKTLRQYFKVLKKYPFHYHGYFIYGNVTETRQEMLYIPKFAVELGLDSIAAMKLRIDKYSSLRGLVESTAGYHIDDGGLAYSDALSVSDLKKVGRQIKFTFYTPARIVKIIGKCLFTVKLFSFKEAASFLLFFPVTIAALIARDLKRGRLADSLKRMFVNNT